MCPNRNVSISHPVYSNNIIISGCLSGVADYLSKQLIKNLGDLENWACLLKKDWRMSHLAQDRSLMLNFYKRVFWNNVNAIWLYF